MSSFLDSSRDGDSGDDDSDYGHTSTDLINDDDVFSQN